MSDDPLPTFVTDRDRAVYLLAEFKWPLFVVVIGAGIWIAALRPELPTPPDWVADWALGWMLLAFPAYLGFRHLADWLYGGDEKVRVAIADPTDGETVIYDAKRVSPDVWDAKTIVGPRPLRVDEGVFDFVVTQWATYEIGESSVEIEVRGCDQSEMTPAEVYQNAARVDDYYQHHHSVKRMYSRLKATVQSYATEIHDLTLMRDMEESEEASIAADVSITGLIDEMESEVEDLPEGPAPETTDRDDGLGDMATHVPEPDMHAKNDEIDVPSAQQTATDGGSDR